MIRMMHIGQRIKFSVPWGDGSGILKKFDVIVGLYHIEVTSYCNNKYGSSNSEIFKVGAIVGLTADEIED